MALEPGFFSLGSSGELSLQPVGATPMRYRVLRVDGTELTPDLPHLTGGTCETNAVVRGLWPPSATIGKLDLPLIPPKAQHLAEEMWPGIDIAALYAQLGYGQRIERYDRVAGGNPNWTGVIHQTPKSFRKFALAALDSWELHQKAEVERKTYFRDTATNIIRDAIKDWTLLYGDDMAAGDMKITDGPGHGVVYSPIATNGGYYNAWSSVTLEDGKNWVTAQPGGIVPTGSMLLNRAWYTSDQMLPSKIDALIRVRPYGTSSAYVGGGIIFGLNPITGSFFQSEYGVDSTAGVGQPAIGHLRLARYSSWGVATQLYDLPFEVGQILPGTPFELNFQMQVLPQPNSGSGSGGIRVLINGLDVQGSTVVTDMSGLSGAIGLYAYGDGQVWARNLFAFDRVPQMTLAPGFPETSPVIELTFNQTSGLDQLMIAANAADISIRKNCKPDMDEIEGVVGDFVQAPLLIAGPAIANGGFESGLTGWTTETQVFPGYTGAILTSAVRPDARGTGWTAGDTFTAYSNLDALGVVDSVDGAGGVLTYHLTQLGSGFQFDNSYGYYAGGSGSLYFRLLVLSITSGSAAAPAISTAQAHGGSHSMFLGNLAGEAEPVGNVSFYRDVVVPTSGWLSFWYWGYSEDSVNYDQQLCQIYGPVVAPSGGPEAGVVNGTFESGTTSWIVSSDLPYIINVGEILASNVATAGTGYVVNDIFGITYGNNSARGTVDSIDGGGGVLTYHLQVPGQYYELGTDATYPVGAGIGTGFTVDITSVQLDGGAITASNINASGTGYAVNDTFYISSTTLSGPTGGGGAQATVDSIGAGGTVLTYHLSPAGASYIAASTHTTYLGTGSGSGATIDITATTPQATGDIAATAVTAEHHSGTHSLRVGAPGSGLTGAQSWAYQDVTVPADATQIELWIKPFNEMYGAGDAGAIAVLVPTTYIPPPGQYIGYVSNVDVVSFNWGMAEDFFWDVPNSPDWHKFTADVTALRGQTWRLLLLTDQWSSDAAGFYVDDITWSTETLPPPLLAGVLRAADDSQTWKQVNTDLSAYAGETVKVWFSVHQEGYGDVTCMYVDDVSWQVRSDVIFKEELDPADPGNVVGGQEQDNASKFATQLKVQGQSTAGTPAVYAVRDLTALRKYGLWTKQENFEDVSSFKVLTAAGDGASVLSGAPASAGTLDVEDGPDTKGRWREGSTIRVQTVHVDVLLADSQREVIGYKETDGSPQKRLILDQYPMTMALPDIKKMQDSIDNLIGAALIYQIPPPGQAGIQPGGPGATNIYGPHMAYNPLTHTWNITNPLNVSGPKVPIGGGGGVNLVTTGGFSLPSPATIAPAASLILSQVPFTVVDHPCWILTFAMLETLSTGGVGEFFHVELRVGPTTATADLVSNDVGMMIDPGNLQKATLIAPNSSPLPVGSYVAYVVATSEGTVGMEITSVAGSFQVYCA